MSVLTDIIKTVVPIEPPKYTVNTEACQKRFKENAYETTDCGIPVIKGYCPKADVSFVISKRELDLSMLSKDDTIKFCVKEACSKNCEFYNEEQKKAKFQVAK